MTSGDYTGMSTAGDTRFFAGATSLAGSGSGVFNVKSNGDVTGSQVLFTGGTIGGTTIDSVSLYSTDKSLVISGSGQITGSTVLFTGGKIGGWDITSTYLADDNNILKLDPDGTYIISSSDFQVSNQGEMTASAGLIGG